LRQAVVACIVGAAQSTTRIGHCQDGVRLIAPVWPGGVWQACVLNSKACNHRGVDLFDTIMLAPWQAFAVLGLWGCRLVAVGVVDGSCASSPFRYLASPLASITPVVWKHHDIIRVGWVF
jgi:hypothetical protein